MKPKMNENANANNETKISCCQVKRKDFRMLSKSQIFENAKIKANE